MPVLLDNDQAKMIDHLRQHLTTADMFRLVTAYFSIYGFDALADKLTKENMTVKFLFGDPESVGNIGTEEKSIRPFLWDENGLAFLAESLHESGVICQSDLARRCAEWIGRESVQICSLRQSNFLHGKMYHVQGGGRQSVTVGSSNFTKRGLGASAMPNLEMNIASEDKKICDETADWFEKLWNDKQRGEDVKGKVLTELQRLYRENAPELIYYKMLYEIFREQLEARISEENRMQDAHFHDTKIWQMLYEFQKDGARSIINRLARHNGCILADSVGLGKTFTALAVIKYFQIQNKDTLVLCPKKLENNWRTYQAAAAHADNPLAEDKFSFHLLSHTDLGRSSGQVGGIDLANFNWSNYGLVVIDESHNFRNATQNTRDDNGKIIKLSRYQKLIEDVIKKGTQTKVLLLSATPVNTSLSDLRNQIYLMTGGANNAFANSLGIHSIKETIDDAQKKFKEWESKAGYNKDELLENLGGKFLNLLDSVSISRSRRQITRFYTNFIEEKGDFPARKLQTEYPPTDNRDELSYKKLHQQIGMLKFHIYRPSDYIVDEEVKQKLAEEKKRFNFNQQTRERFLVDMMRINFLKRLESSAHALKLTLERTIGKIDAMTDKISAYDKRLISADIMLDSLPDDDDEDDDFIVNRKAINPYHLRELDTAQWCDDMLKDRQMLTMALHDVEKITPQRDGKLDMFKAHLKAKAAQKNRKLLVFTTFQDTAKYLWDNIQDTAKELGLTVGLVTGEMAQTTLPNGGANFNAVLSDFAPMARNRAQGYGEIDLLIATDCISEGQNLQDCDAVLNYDIHWNPVRIIQRFGRIDRIGSRNKIVQMINYWPTKDMNLYLNLETRVRARMALADATATGDENYLENENYLVNDDLKQTLQRELNFRYAQAKRMQEEILDLDENPKAVSMSDLTLDYFFTQLLRFIQKKREELDALPLGAHAVVDCATVGDLLPDTKAGAVFLFRQIQAATQNPNNPTHPSYLMQVEKDQVRRNYGNTPQILKLLEALTVGKNKPLTDLCDDFNREIKTAEGAKHYNTMAFAAVRNIADTFQSGTLEGVATDPGALIPKSKEKPEAPNLELIAWVVMKDKT